MPRGGYRVGSGRKPGSRKALEKAAAADAAGAVQATPGAGSEAALPEDLDPLTYLTRVMNDPLADPHRRDRAAIAAMPFTHARSGADGKKEERSKAARVAAGGKFAPDSAPPRLVVNNK